MEIDPGGLNKQITIISRTAGGQDSAGFDLDPSVTTIRTCWAQVSNTSGKEIITSGRELSQAKKRFLIRDNGTPITTSMIIQYNSAEYDIQYVNSYGDSHEYLEIWTEWRDRS